MVVIENIPGGLLAAGYIPGFLSDESGKPAREQIADNYRHGGGWNPMRKWSFQPKTAAIAYPGDDELLPAVTIIMESGEMVHIYRHSWVCIVQPDGETFEVARVD